ncbi:MAG: thiamine pyrophosphate-dependent enzyme [Planctomycetes bacterium]|nr:thiamine pyrophosphate-dependent enzyme [Planctomycetota bacterium]
MTTNRVAVVEANLDAFLESASPASTRLAGAEPLRPVGRLTARNALALFECQLESRALDVAARELKRTGRSFYTIGSAGHENNVCLGALLRLDDPCVLHYRSGAWMMARARKLPGSTPVFDTLLSLVASKDDPIAQGRHKVWGSRELWVPPQTSTIASHLPKASGMALAIGLARRLGVENDLAGDSIVACSFGDASFNHATALAGIHSARWAKRRGAPVPVLWVCEDNGIGISVETPKGWIADTAARLPYLDYFHAAGELDEIYDVAAAAIEHCRRTRTPTFLHLETVRLWGHAGSDVETTYHTLDEIEANEAKDPLLRNARRLVELGVATPAELQALVRDVRQRVLAAAEEAVRRPKLVTREEIVAPLAPYDETRCRAAAATPRDAAARQRAFEVLPEQVTSATKKTMAAHLNAALADELAHRRELVLFGEDVGKKGGVYGVTAGLQKRFGLARVFDSLLDETSILGLAQGMAHVGLLPVPEIQYLAYIHNALDQLRGEACSLAYFSSGQFTNPMVVRIQGLAYQKGFGGHFHNDNSIGALRDIPGLVLATPARGDDAAKMLRGCLTLAKEHGRVVCFLEPIALYHERDLYADGDHQWLFDYPAPEEALLPGDVGVYHAEHRKLLIVSYANGLRLSLRAAKRLKEEFDIEARVLDLRWLNPLPMEAIATHLAECDHLLVVDECRATGGGIADPIVAALAEAGFSGVAGSVRAADCYVPLGAATQAVLVGEDDIVAMAKKVCA